VLSAVKNARELGIADFILCGDKEKIKVLLEEIGDSQGNYDIRHSAGYEEAANAAARLVTDKDALTIMKGRIQTGTLLKILLKDEYSFKTGKTMSLSGVFEIPDFPRLLIVSDPGMVPYPTLEQKVDIINNAVIVASAIGIEIPKTGILASVETVNLKMQATMDAAVLSKMADRGQIKGTILDGPFALDNVVSEESAKHKGIISPVAGKADIVIVPDIDAGNLLYKALIFLARAKVATTILGGGVPIILTSRADSEESKLYSIALNVLLSGVKK